MNLVSKLLMLGEGRKRFVEEAANLVDVKTDEHNSLMTRVLFFTSANFQKSQHFLSLVTQ